MNERKLLTLRFPFRAIRFRPGGRSGRVGAITPHILGSGARTRGYHANDPPEDSGESGAMSIWPAVMQLLSPDCSDMGTPRVSSLLPPSVGKFSFSIPFFSFFFLRSLAFFPFPSIRGLSSFAFLDPPNSSSTSSLYFASQKSHLSWFRTDHIVGLRMIRISVKRIR